MTGVDRAGGTVKEVLLTSVGRVVGGVDHEGGRKGGGGDRESTAR